MRKYVTLSLILFALIITGIFVIGFWDKHQNNKKEINNNNQQQTATEITASEESSQSQNKIYSLEEVGTHNSEADCWIVINKDVLNVTAFLTIHPGGKDKISPNCGKDATIAFSTKGNSGETHSSKANAEFVNYKIGVIN